MNNDLYTDVLSVFPLKIRRMLDNVPDFSRVSEIRMRLAGALCTTGWDGICFLRDAGYSFVSDENAYIVTSHDISEVIEKSCGYSVYAHEDELRQGYITYGNGHRIGISGSVYGSNGGSDLVTSLCVRVARNYPNAADELLGSLYGTSLPGVILAGAPGTGKTTMLRAAAKALSKGATGRAYRVSVIDERYELAGRNGNAYSLCRYADILGGCPKGEGILRAVRLLSPDIIVCDEIGSTDEAECIASVLGTGVKFLASIHASSFSQLENNSRFRILRETQAFDFAVLLDSPGKISNIYDLRGDCDEIYCGGAYGRGTVRMGIV